MAKKNIDFKQYPEPSFWIGVFCCCYLILSPSSSLYASEVETTEESQPCIFLRGIWKGVLYLVNHGQQQVMVTVSQEDCNISINTSSNLPYGQFFTGRIESNGDLLVYDVQTSEYWTSLYTEPTITAFTIYDYVNEFSRLDKLELIKKIDKGDVDNNYFIELKDAILVAKILTGTETSTTCFVESDVNGDNKIGMAELVFILQELSQ